MIDSPVSTNLSRHVAIYERVSTEAQSVEMQEADLKAFCMQRGFTVYRVYSDHGISGTKERRPALDELMADARKGKFDVVLVWDFSRFARSTKHLITALDEFRHLSIEFISYRENIDTSSPLGKAMFTIVAAIAELERSIIVERIKSGLRRAKAMGKKIGRPGLQMNTERIMNLKTQGLSIRAIAKRGPVNWCVNGIRRRPLDRWC
jgi:DNA invertase Pin-like site-specific DNA recombinase